MAPNTHDPAPDYADAPVELLRRLVRFDTSNPPGDERACIEWIDDLLSGAGFRTERYASTPERPNLIARLPGGSGPPLMLYGHADVVPADAEDWTHPPFEAVVDDGYVWGRGTLDMKGGLAMMLAAGLRVARRDDPLAGDLVVAVFADEEGGGDAGADFVVEHHPEVFEGIEHAVGEFGGFSMTMAGERVYPIQLNEKVVCWSELTFHGPGGHGSLPHAGGAMAAMARAVTALDGARLPVHVTPTVEEMVERVAAAVDGETGASLRALLDSDRTDDVLDDLGADGVLFDAVLHNTANPTVVAGGETANVIPSEVSLTLDCRLLPGQTPADLERELRAVIPDDVEYDFAVRRHEPFPAETDPELFPLLADVLEGADPDGTAVPFLVFGGTDARHLARAGVQSYGFTPMPLPEEFAFLETIHGADERIPVDAVEFGAERLVEVLERYGEWVGADD